ncbi:MAG: zinc-dependent metalloprotease, partial [Candidatus Geothermincolia bacterium]
LDADDFRLWITLHEVTHAVEFRAHPWLRSHMKQLMEEYFQSVALRLEDVGSRFKRRSVSRDGDLREIMKQGGVISLVSTPEQRLMLLRIQAFMSLIEGYSNLVMDGVGKEVIASYEQMSAAFKRRQETKTGAERLAQRMLGFDLKLRQYQVGELFCREVMEKEGLPYLNRVWEAPENLPTSEEIEQPFRWIDRMRGAGERVTHYSA